MSASPIAPTPPAPPPLGGSISDGEIARHERLRALDWHASGVSKVVGDVEVAFARLEGMITVGGSLTAGDLGCRGTLHARGPTRVAGPLALNGLCRTPNSVRAGSVDAVGHLEVGGDLVVDGAANLHGRAEIGGSLSAGSLQFAAELQVHGAVTATDSIRGELEGEGRAASLAAPRVEITRGGGPRLPPWSKPGTFETLRVVGDELRLEGVVAEFVRADAIYLGPECRIARVEGTIVEQHRSARVGPSVVSRAAPGLWR